MIDLLTELFEAAMVNPDQANAWLARNGFARLSELRHYPETAAAFIAFMNRAAKRRADRGVAS